MRGIFLFILLIVMQIASAQNNNTYFLKLNKDFTNFELIKNFPGVTSFQAPFLLKEMKQTYLVSLVSDQVKDNLFAYLTKKKALIYIEPIPEYKLFFVPNDLNSAQYNLSITNAELAWDIDNDASDMTIAIIDDAIDLLHIDLSANIFQNLLDIPLNGLDDDGNGFIDDINGWDFADNDNNVNPPNATMSHGTHVAGIASASTNNGIGISAIGANAKILPIKIGANSNGALLNTYQAIEYAILMEVDVINMSWGGGAYSSTFQDLFDIAYAQEIVCIAAAGNSSSSAPMYPASYNYVISVASTNQTDAKSNFSNFGSTVDLAAPGSGIYSLIPFSSYDYKSGTSMAAPYVAGLAALMKSSSPLATVDQIELCLESTCDPVNGTFSSQIGSGRVNALAAMECITIPTAAFTSNIIQVCPGEIVDFIDQSTGLGLSYSWSFPGGVPNASTLQNPSISYPNGGTYTVVLQITDGTFSNTYTSTNYISVAQPTATISGYSTINSGGYGSVVINFTGNPPYNVDISDGSLVTTVTNISSSPYLHFFNPTNTTNYNLTNFSDSQCSGTLNGSATIEVLPDTGATCIDSLSTFVKYLGTNVDDFGQSLQDIGEYGFIIMGRKVLGTATFRNYICRLDNCGYVIWEKIFQPNEYGIPVAAQMDGNEILISGYRNTSSSSNNVTGSRTYLLRLDLNGNIINSKRFGGSSVYPRQMLKTDNGELVFSGVSNDIGAGANDFYIARSTITGTLLWGKAYGGNANDFGHNIIEDSNGDLVSIGYSRDYVANTFKGKIIKVDANGTEVWTKEYYHAADRTVFSDIDEYQGNYYIVGYTTGGSLGGFEQLVVKMDLSGNLVWSKVLGGPGYDRGSGIRVRNDTVYVHGLSDAGATSREIVVSRMTLSGNLIDYVGIGTSNDDINSGSGSSLILGDDQGIYGVAAGNGGYIGQDDIIFFKLNDFTDLCAPLTLNLQIDNISLIKQTFSSSTTNSTWNFVSYPAISVDVISNQGYICDSLTFSDTNTIINCNLLANFTTIVPDCIEDSVVFIDLSTYNGTANLYQYDFGDLSPVYQTSDSIVSYYYLAPGTYPVLFTAIDTINGCLDTVSLNITINSTPSITLIDSAYICLSDSINITASFNCISDSAIINWFPNSSIVSDSSQTVTLIPANSGYVYITVDDNGIITTDSIYISVDSSCCSSITQIELGSNSDFCGNGSIEIINTSISNSGVPIYNWQFLPDGTPISFTGTTPPIINFTGTGQKSIILQILDDCGVSQDTFPIYIFDDPVFASGLDDTLCQGELIDLGEPFIGGWSYHWSPGNLVSDSLSSNPTTYIDSTTTISVKVVDNWTGCVLNDTVTFIFDSVFVNIEMADSTICLNSQDPLLIPFTAYSNTGNLEWTPVSIISPYNANSVLASLENSTLISLHANGITGKCKSIDSLWIEVQTGLVPINIDTIICEDKLFHLQPKGNWTAGGTQVTKLALETGLYYFNETSSCNSVEHKIAIKNKNCSCDIYIPNVFTPDNNNLNNTFKPLFHCEFYTYQLDIFNRWGELLYTSKNPESAWDGTYNHSLVQDGVYIWQLTYSESNTKTQQIKRGHVAVMK